jgi:small subunit ribosomal protein S17
MIEATQKIIRRLRGEVVSDKMEKTIVVRVDRVKVHPKYKKRYTVSDKYKAHDERNLYKIGDMVEITSSRPRSKTKRWRVVYSEDQARQETESVVDTGTLDAKNSDDT